MSEATSVHSTVGSDSFVTWPDNKMQIQVSTVRGLTLAHVGRMRFTPDELRRHAAILLAAAQEVESASGYAQTVTSAQRPADSAGA